MAKILLQSKNDYFSWGALLSTFFGKNYKWLPMLAVTFLVTNCADDFSRTINDDEKPTVRIDQPIQTSRYLLNQTIKFSGIAQDNVKITQVYIGVGGEQYLAKLSFGIYNPVQKQYTRYWYLSIDAQTLGVGTHDVMVVAQDGMGNQSVAKLVTIAIDPLPIEDTQAPTLTITTPANNSVFNPGQTVSLTGIARDNSDVVEVEISYGLTLESAFLLPPVIDVNTGEIIRDWQLNLASTALGIGQHVFSVVAKDSSGNTSAVNMVTITVENEDVIVTEDTQAPTLTITTPANNATYGGNATIALTGAAFDNVDITDVRVTFNSSTTTAITAAPVPELSGIRRDWQLGISTLGISEGSHLLSVVAQDSAGNISTQTTQTVVIDLTGPAVEVTHPESSLDNITSTIFSFTASTDAVLPILCSIDGGPADVCTSPHPVMVIGEGSHSFYVTATDAYGNSTTDGFSWLVDTTPPVVTIDDDTAPAPLTNVSNIEIAFTVSGHTSYVCQFNGNDFGQCDSSFAQAITSDGNYTFSVTAVDAFANAATDSVTWTLRTTPPIAELSGLPATETTNTAIDVTVGGTYVHTYQYKIDGSSSQGPFSVTEAIELSSLAVTSHTLEVVGCDVFNQCQSYANPTSHTWEIKPGWQSLASSLYHTCAIDTLNHLYCWGDNFFGQTSGDGTDGDSKGYPWQVTTPSTWSAVSVGEGHTCGITTNQELYCWGYNANGQVGDGTAMNVLLPTQVANPAAWLSVDAGRYYTCGITTNQELYCWGDDTYGQIGDGSDNTDKLLPTAVSIPAQWLSVAAGSNHTCGITTANMLYCWGYGEGGALGDGNDTNQNFPSQVTNPVQWSSVANGDGHTCGITDTDTLYCWGADTSGAVGDGPTATDKPTPLLVPSFALTSVVAAGELHTCAVTLTQELYCWGDNTNGQIGIGSMGVPVVDPVAVVSSGQLWSHVAPGAIHTCALTASNEIYCWGDDSLGQLGDDANTNNQNPGDNSRNALDLAVMAD